MVKINKRMKTVLKWAVIILVPCGLIALLVFKFLPAVWNKIKSTFGLGETEEERKAKQSKIAGITANGAGTAGIDYFLLADEIENLCSGISTPNEEVYIKFKTCKTTADLEALYIAYGLRSNFSWTGGYKADLITFLNDECNAPTLKSMKTYSHAWARSSQFKG